MNFSLCEEVRINISDIVNDGKRGLKKIYWSLSSMNPINKVNRLQIFSILEEANSVL